MVSGRWSVVGGSVVVVVVRGQALEQFTFRVCKDSMHCCSPVFDPKLLVKTVHLP